MSNYRLDAKWFVNNGEDKVILSGKNRITIDGNKILSQKVLGKLFALNKPYIIDEDSIVNVKEVEVKKPKKVVKKKKIKIDEPEEESPIKEENSKESDLSEEGES